MTQTNFLPPEGWREELNERHKGFLEFAERARACTKRPRTIELIERIKAKFGRPNETWRELCVRLKIPRIGSFELERWGQGKLASPLLPEISVDVLAAIAEALSVTSDWLLFGRDGDDRLVAAIDSLREDQDADVNRILGVKLDPRPKLSDVAGYNPFDRRKLNRQVKAQAESIDGGAADNPVATEAS
jgi:hypothetical protein